MSKLQRYVTEALTIADDLNKIINQPIISEVKLKKAHNQLIEVLNKKNSFKDDKLKIISPLIKSLQDSLADSNHVLKNFSSSKQSSVESFYLLETLAENNNLLDQILAWLPIQERMQLLQTSKFFYLTILRAAAPVDRILPILHQFTGIGRFALNLHVLSKLAVQEDKAVNIILDPYSTRKTQQLRCHSLYQFFKTAQRDMSLMKAKGKWFELNIAESDEKDKLALALTAIGLLLSLIGGCFFLAYLAVKGRENQDEKSLAMTAVISTALLALGAAIFSLNSFAKQGMQFFYHYQKKQLQRYLETTFSGQLAKMIERYGELESATNENKNIFNTDEVKVQILY